MSVLRANHASMCALILMEATPALVKTATRSTHPTQADVWVSIVLEVYTP